MKKQLGLLLLLVFASSAVLANTYTVTNCNDTGAGTLRQAVKDANNNPGADTIAFNIPAADPGYQAADGYWLISPLTALGNLTDNDTTIDGSTQTTNQGDTNKAGPEIMIDGTNIVGLGMGIGINSANNVIKNLIVSNCSHTGIIMQFNTATDNRITGCYVGTDARGAAARGNTTGVALHNNADRNIIGGTTAAERNVISGNGRGILVNSINNIQILGNYIGTNASGTSALANAGGIELYENTRYTTIEGNIISGNSSEAVDIDSSSYNQVKGNYIGTDATGMIALGNGQGIQLYGSCEGNIIGGSTAAERNLISGNGNAGGAEGNVNNGIAFYVGGGNLDQGPASNEVSGNYIGVNRTGTAALENNGEGVDLSGNYNNISQNVISGNNREGILIIGNYNTCQGNYIGLNAAGTAAVQNGAQGVHVSGGNNNVIGGATAAARNVISGNSQEAIGIEGDNNRISGNYLGVDATGRIAIPQQDGVKIISGNGNVIGGTTIAEANVICGSVWMGVLITGSSNEVKNNYIGLAADGVTLLGNNCGIFMYSNAQHNQIAGNTFAYNGIPDWADVSIDEAGAKYNTVTRNLFISTRNQAILITNGANGGISSPYIDLVSNEGLVTTTVSGTAPASSVIEVFQAIPPSTEANAFLGSVESSAAGDWSIALSGSFAANEVSATATDRSGNTSQFSINNVSTTTTTTTTTSATVTTTTSTTTTTKPGISEVTIDATPAAIALRFNASEVTSATLVFVDPTPPPQVIKEVVIAYVSVGLNIINSEATSDAGVAFSKHQPYAYKLISGGKVVSQGTFMVHD